MATYSREDLHAQLSLWNLTMCPDEITMKMANGRDNFKDGMSSQKRFRFDMYEAEPGIRLSSCVVKFSSSISAEDNACRSSPTGIVQPLIIAASIHEFLVVDTPLILSYVFLH